jgi:hypothetical protein
MKILFDKTKNTISNDDYWIDQDGELWVNSNPFGAVMNSKISIMPIPKGHYKYELRDSDDIGYSEEEVLDILFKHTEYFVGFGERISLTDWFEQVKKK